MNGHGKSDRPVVPGKSANNGGAAVPPAEQAEGRGWAKGNPERQTSLRTQGRAGLQQALDRIRQAADRDKQAQLTALWHHVYNLNHLREAYFGLTPQAAAGVDEQTWEQYGEALEDNLRDLSERLKRGGYRAQPVRRAWIPKADGRQRPIGVPTLEDKIVQRTAAAVMQAVYEADFKGFSYGFRPGRGAHQALDALSVGIMRRKINWVLDADIRGFFDAISHEWMMKFIGHRIADWRLARHIKKWLNAGVLEEGKLIRAGEGVPQGGSISPVLANVYLHYAFDLWADHWRRRRAQGQMIMVRYADDFVVGFQHRREAERFLKELKERFLKFNLQLHADKTRLIEFGRFASERRAARGGRKPETFDFLGFTHISGKTNRGEFIVRRRPIKARMRATLHRIKEVLMRRRHAPIAETGQWLRAVVMGWYRYYAVPMTEACLMSFRRCVVWLWFRALKRRSQRTRMTWRRMYALMNRWIPRPRILHPYPWDRLGVATQGRSPVR